MWHRLYRSGLCSCGTYSFGWMDAPRLSRPLSTPSPRMQSSMARQSPRQSAVTSDPAALPISPSQLYAWHEVSPYFRDGGKLVPRHERIAWQQWVGVSRSNGGGGAPQRTQPTVAARPFASVPPGVPIASFLAARRARDQPAHEMRLSPRLASMAGMAAIEPIRLQRPSQAARTVARFKPRGICLGPDGAWIPRPQPAPP